MAMRRFALAAAILLAGCAARQSAAPSSSSIGQGPAISNPQPAQTSVSTTAAQSVATTPAPIPPVQAQPLPFKGRLADGDPDELPPSVAMSLSSNSAVVFSYREELTHDEYHIPLWFSAIDPVTYLGSPLGDYGVTAFASLSVADGDRILGDYTAKVHVSKSYNLYSEPTHQELEQEARTAVRARIDQKLHQVMSRLTEQISSASPSTSGASAR
jgi:hypothetical protein